MPDLLSGASGVVGPGATAAHSHFFSHHHHHHRNGGGGKSPSPTPDSLNGEDGQDYIDMEDDEAEEDIDPCEDRLACLKNI